MRCPVFARKGGPYLDQPRVMVPDSHRPMDGERVPVAPDGSFAISDLVSGHYVLRVG